MIGRGFRLAKAVFVVLFYRTPAILVCLVSIIGIGFVTRYAYYRYMPATWFVQLTQPASVNNGALGKPLTLTFCRHTRADNIKATGYRSFYLLVDNRETPAGDYTFPLTLEHNDACQYPTIKPENLPNVAGTYKMHTDLEFYVEGHKKILRYDLDKPFTISDTARSLQQRIDELQQQIDELKSRQPQSSLDAHPQPKPETFVVSVAKPVSTPITVPPMPVTVSTRPSTPPSSAPPAPPSQPTSVDPQPQSGVVALVEGTLGELRTQIGKALLLL